MSVLVQVLQLNVREQFNTENLEFGSAKTQCPSLIPYSSRHLNLTTEMNFLVLESNYDCSDLFEILLAHIRDISRKTTY